VNPDTSTRKPSKDPKAPVKRSGGIRRLTDGDIHVAMSYREEGLDNTKYSANVGVVILLIVIVFAFVALFFHVANR
jgi:hypothetical protein